MPHYKVYKDSRQSDKYRAFDTDRGEFIGPAFDSPDDAREWINKRQGNKETNAAWMGQ